MGTNVEQEQERKQQILSSILAKNGYKKWSFLGRFGQSSPLKWSTLHTEAY